MPRCHQRYRKSTFFDEKLDIERHCLENNYISEIWPLVSGDGIHFTRFQNMIIRGDGTDHQDFIYGIDGFSTMEQQIELPALPYMTVRKNETKALSG